MRQRYTATCDSTSYRAELEGIYGVLKMMNELGVHGLRQICDNEEAIRMIDENLTPSQMTSPEADIILACQEMIRTMESKPKLAWVRGHQDGKKKKKYGDLSTDAQVNVDMDDECDKERREGRPLPVRPLKGSGAMLAINNRFITTNYKQNIHEAIMKGEHR